MYIVNRLADVGRRTRRRGRPALRLGVAALAAWLAAGTAGAADERFGEYLAARLAGATGDLAGAAAYYDMVLAVDSDNPSLLFMAALYHLPNGNVDRAVELSERLLERSDNPDMVSTASLISAVGAAGRGDWDAAVELTRRVPPAGMNRLLAPLAEAWTLIGAGATEDGLQALEELSGNPQYASFFHYHRALVHELAGNAEAAEEAYRMALGVGAGARQVEGFGRLLERADRADEAIEMYQRLLEAQPENRLLVRALARAEAGETPEPLVRGAADGLAEVFHGAASSLVREGSTNPARNFASLAVYLRDGFGAALAILAETMQEEEAYDQANAVLRRVPPESAYSWDARMRVALNLSRLGAVDEAVAMLDAMAGERPDDLDALTTLGDVLRRSERYAEAAVAYTRAVDRIGAIQRNHWVLLYTRGTAYERSSQWDNAEADFLRALELEPDQPFVLNYLGYSWIEMGRNLEEATDMIARAVEQQPTAGFIVDSLGWAHFKLGNYQEAARQLERAVQLTPADPTINEHLGDAYWYAGRRREAVFQWRRALDLGAGADRIPLIESKLVDGLPD